MQERNTCWPAVKLSQFLTRFDIGYVPALVWCFKTIRLFAYLIYPYLLWQIKAAVAALRNTRGLTWPTSFEQQKQKAGELDLLDWLRAMFGFQVSLPIKGIKLAIYFSV